MDLKLKNKKALITGASRGLGYAVARCLLSEGASVTINSREAVNLEEARNSLSHQGKVGAIAGDVTIPTSCIALLEEAVERMGGLDLLVTNSGGPKTGRFETMSDDDWLQAFQLNFLSHVRLIRAALPYLRQSDAPSILTVTSISAKQPIPDMVLSNSLRAGVLGLTKTLSQELGSEGIRVNSILPGFTLTDRAMSLLRDRAQKNNTSMDIEIHKQSEASALKRIAAPEEFARVAVFLLSPAASYLTGLMLPVDGGAYTGLI
ncbi:MAG: 3-oxoacyl-ACP reductase [Anaerolinea sp.]|nr:3-oxoacyl-ACP reductase [Anaerolinea sp.]